MMSEINKIKFGIKDYFLMFKKRGLYLPIYYFFQNHLFDLLHGTDTHILLEKKNYINKPKNIDHGVLYMASSYSTIKNSTYKVLKLFKLNTKDICFIDIGCGKGKVLIIWNKIFPNAKKIIGIEYCSSLVKICKKNLEKTSSYKIKIICKDASEQNYNFTSKVNLIYLYNPFNKKILNKVIKKIKNNKTIVIYNNSVHRDLFLLNGFKLHFEKKGCHPLMQYSILSNYINS